MSFISAGEYICMLNCVGYLGAIISIIMLILNLIFFVSPNSPIFSSIIDKNNKHDEDSTSFTQVNQIAI